MSLPSLESAQNFAKASFGNLSTDAQAVRYRLCELVEESVIACADGEELDVLRPAAYLQEVGVIHSSKEKAIYSLQMVESFYSYDQNFEELDPRLYDTIQNHVRGSTPSTAEGLLMRICHKYAVCHYLDYTMFKAQVSLPAFERLQLERIDAYAQWLDEHPRGEQINAALQKIFLYKNLGRPGRG
ncbi:MAG: hypothetical protein ACI8XO_003157 [Verrucomicrobiales bacterium]|jgi:hypothetical protein